jgi:protein TonB
MQIKKNPEVDVRNLRLLFFIIAFILTLGIAIAIFSYTSEEEKEKKKEEKGEMIEQEQTEITRQDDETPPPPPQKVEIKVFNDVLEIVTNDQKIETEINFEEEFGENFEFVQQVEVVEETIEDDQPFVKVEQMPKFQGGDLSTFRNWVMSRLRYPQIAQENGIQGRVLLAFVVEKDGSLTNIQVLQTPDSSLSDEAIRILKSSPKWTPGKQRNQTVRVKYTLPVDFRIQN